MKKLSSFIDLLYPLLVIALLSKAISVAFLFFLPLKSLQYPLEDDLALPFRSYPFDKEFGLTIMTKKVIKIKKPSYDLKSMTLQAIYKDKNGGYIVVEDKKDKKTAVLSLNETYKGYKLSEIHKQYVIFVKNSKRYTLKLFSNLKINNLPETKSLEIKDNYKVPKKEVLKYTKNFDAIWKNISINEIKKGEKITGFRIDYIKKGSAFDKLGLKRGDIIKMVNNEPLTSYAQAFKIYNNINKYDYITITVLRNGLEKDFDYEIR